MKKILISLVLFTFVLFPVHGVQACSIRVASVTSFSALHSDPTAYFAASKDNLCRVVVVPGFKMQNEFSSTAASGPIIKVVRMPATLKNPYQVTTTTARITTPTPEQTQQQTPVSIQTPASLSQEQPSGSSMQNEMLSYINAARSQEGLEPLVLDEKLSQGAYLKSKDMAVNNYFSHTSPTYGSPFEMMNSLGISYRTAGENIAKNFSVKGAHDAFMNSSGHRANILNGAYHKVGLGFYQQGSYLYVTQWFTN